MSIRGGSSYVKLAKWGKWHPTLKGKTRCGLRGKPRKTSFGISDDPMCCDCARSVLVGLGATLLARTYRTRLDRKMRAGILEIAGQEFVVASRSDPPLPVAVEPGPMVPFREIVIVAAVFTVAIALLLAGLFK